MIVVLYADKNHNLLIRFPEKVYPMNIFSIIFWPTIPFSVFIWLSFRKVFDSLFASVSTVCCVRSVFFPWVSSISLWFFFNFAKSSVHNIYFLCPFTLFGCIYPVYSHSFRSKAIFRSPVALHLCVCDCEQRQYMGCVRERTHKFNL